jgi:hypothetical protein
MLAEGKPFYAGDDGGGGDAGTPPAGFTVGAGRGFGKAPAAPGNDAGAPPGKAFDSTGFEKLRERLLHWVEKAKLYSAPIRYVTFTDPDEEIVRVIIKDSVRTFFHEDPGRSSSATTGSSGLTRRRRSVLVMRANCALHLRLWSLILAMNPRR